ncbi:non-specific lipid transfer protein GPI-anchored 1-like [Vicia villosa]|uniref:non-specific lipid transfer protein GPI-anchored 1-like n=1 Tax=Vicia villosa TaxID=3911 RepID=UPI00273C3516|nr:non-specific lipid transfer protein GPI-anchored 1-like [Vicia villosa]
MKHQTFTCLCVLALTIIVCSNVSNAAEDLSKTCGQVVSKVIPCLDFATGKAPTPKKECCDAAKSIKDTDPECLCYIIQQTHKGSPESKSMGIQEDKLLQLAGVCGVKANISDCPSTYKVAGTKERFDDIPSPRYCEKRPDLCPAHPQECIQSCKKKGITFGNSCEGGLCCCGI